MKTKAKYYLTNRAYWQEKTQSGSFSFFRFEHSSNYEKYLKRYLQADPNKTCIEIGAFPGGNLGYLAKVFQYKPVALDIVDEIDFIKANMEYNSIYNCEIIKKDFFGWIPKEQYDVVSSFGFVEHFRNHEEAIQKHIDILKKNGILIISVPNFNYLQFRIRQLLYTKEKYESVVAAHNREVMNLKILRNIIFRKNNLRKIFAGFIRGMTIWFPADEQTIRMEKIRIYKMLKILEKAVNMLHISNRFISPEMLVLGEKQ